MLDPQELRNGTVFKLNGNTYLVLKYEHNKRGRGHATIRVKLKDIVNGTTIEKTFTDGDKLERAEVTRRNCQFLYKDGEKLYFMDTNDFSQFEFAIDDYEWESKLMKEGMTVQTMWLDGNAISFELPPSIDLKVISTTNAVAGDTASGASKDAELETGFIAKVPLFITNDNTIRIKTEDGTYSGKA